MALCFFLLYASFGGSNSPLVLVPAIGHGVDAALRHPVDLLTQWVGIHVFHLQIPSADLYLQATGDGPIRWVAIPVLFALAVIAAAAWSALDRRADQSASLLGALRLLLRFTLGLALLRYGFIKIFPLQFPPPPLALLNEPVGNASPTLLFWSLYGLKPAFEMALGWTEVVTGLLLFFQRTAFLGSIIALGVMANVAALDLTFDVPVKLYSMALVLIAMVLLLPETGLLWRLFLTGQPVAARQPWSPPRLGPIGQRRLLVAEIGVAALACWQNAFGTWSVWRMKAAATRDPASITGEWAIQDVDPRLVGGDGSPIVTIFFDPDTDTYLRAADGSLWRCRAVYDVAQHRLRVLYEVRGMMLFQVQQPDGDHLTLQPAGPTAGQIHALTMTRVPLPREYPLLQRWFHWTSTFEPLR